MVNLSKISEKDILIIGDSFCHSRKHSTDWPVLVANSLITDKKEKIIVRGKGIPGASWWSTRKLLLEELKVHIPKILIITHTEVQRIPNDDDYSLNSSSVFDKSNIENIPEKLRIAAQMYYENLFSVDFHIWAQKQWYSELDSIIETHNIPRVVHFHSFKPWGDEKLYVFKNGTTFDKVLWDNSDDRYILEKYKDKLSTQDTTLLELQNKYEVTNHLNKDKNNTIALSSVNAIKNNLTGLRHLPL